FSNHTATTEIYTLSLHDALPISTQKYAIIMQFAENGNLRDYLNNSTIKWEKKLFMLQYIAESLKFAHEAGLIYKNFHSGNILIRSEEHTSELQSRRDLVCRLLLE